MQGDVKDILLLDVIPLSLGIETLGNVSTKLIERNTTIPTTKSQTFSTAADNQTSVEIHVVQGERTMSQDNKSLGRFILDGIPPAPRGTPQVEVSFDINADGILEVKAKDKSSGKEQSIRIEATSGLSEEDIEKMKKDAESHAEEDKKAKESADARNVADQIIYTAENALKEHGKAISDDIKKSVQDKINALKKAKEGGDGKTIKQATTALSTEMQKIGEAVAAQTKAEGGQSAPQGGTDAGAEGVRDADFTEGDKGEDTDTEDKKESK
jgi:molecular chaperone DnaK